MTAAALAFPRVAQAVCLSAADCDDANPCTDDACDDLGVCTHDANALPCDDGDACSEGDICRGGACLPGAALACADANPCTDDACDSAVGCVFTPNAAPCDDADPCTVNDVCGAGVCQPGPPRHCDDFDPCTDDACDAHGECVFTPIPRCCAFDDDCPAPQRCQGGRCLGAALCEPCDRDDGCGDVGDLCVQLAEGFVCGQDCRTAACPAGYRCNRVSSTRAQCVPDAGACDCAPHHTARCSDGHIYWFDRCGGREELLRECRGGCAGNECLFVPPPGPDAVTTGDVEPGGPRDGGGCVSTRRAARGATAWGLIALLALPLGLVAIKRRNGPRAPADARG